MFYLLAHSRDNSRAIRAEHVGKLRLRSKHLGETSFAFENVPHTNSGNLNADEDVVLSYIGDWQRL
jgi:hypothetical protein